METLADLILDTPRSELLEIIGAYNDYVVNFYDGHDEGSFPVSLMEYYNNDYQQEMKDKQLDFTDDVEKMIDFFNLPKDEFLKFYYYLTEDEYNKTKEAYEADKADVFSRMMREAENIHIEDMNGRNNREALGLSTGSELKEMVEDLATKNLTEEEFQDYRNYCYDLAC